LSGHRFIGGGSHDLLPFAAMLCCVMPLLPKTIGEAVFVETLNGDRVRYVNLDNTATTPAFVEVRDAVNAFIQYYGSIHRGSGYKSLFSTWLYEQARMRVGEFVGADPAFHEVLFTANTTTAINKAARVLGLTKRDVVLVSTIEHSSNELPWRQCATLERYAVNPDNTINLASIERQVKRLGRKVKLVAVTGASNVTGYISPCHEIARLAHARNVPVFVDCAQLAPHRRIVMGVANDPEHLDFISFSGHKLGAPFGTGVLVGPARCFDPRTVPSDEPGGGTADIVTENDTFWAASPERFEAGTPNAVGVVALAKAIEILDRFGLENIEAYETRLWLRACKGLKRISGLTLYVDPTRCPSHTPVIPFNIQGCSHGLVAAILGFEYGIGVRHGRHCADSLILRLLHYSRKQRDHILKQVLEKGMMTEVYGVVRPSIGFCNQEEDIDRLVDAVHRISKDGTKFKYEPEYLPGNVANQLNRQTGEYLPAGSSIRVLLRKGLPSKKLQSIGLPLRKTG